MKRKYRNNYLLLLLFLVCCTKNDRTYLTISISKECQHSNDQFLVIIDWVYSRDAGHSQDQVANQFICHEFENPENIFRFASFNELPDIKTGSVVVCTKGIPNVGDSLEVVSTKFLERHYNKYPVCAANIGIPVD